MPDFWPWAFPVSTAGYAGTITTINRTLPDRLSDIVNVKDWGATGDGSTDDRGFIQNAIDFCISRGGGTVSFPPGTYKCVGSGLMVGTNDSAQRTNGIQLIGSGGGAFDNTNIDSQSAGPPGHWVISKGTRTYDLIVRVEGLGFFGTGAIKVTGEAVTIKSCSFNNHLVAVDASEAKGCSVTDCAGAGGDGTVPFADTGVGVYLGDNCIVSNCRIMGSNFITYALSGTGAAVMGGVSTEGTTIACRVGWGPADPNVIGGGMEVPAYACTVTGMQTERQLVSLDIYNATGCLVTGNILTGGHAPDPDKSIGNLHWSAGTVTATTGGHGLPPGNTWILLSANAGLAWNPTGTTKTLVTNATPTTFTYPLAANPGADTIGTWSYAPKYCIRVRKAHECVFAGNQVELNAALAAVDLDYNGEAVHSNNLFLSVAGVKGGWIPPVGRNAAGWTFVQCGGNYGLFNSAVNNPTGNLTFGNLPGQFTPVFDPNGIALYQGGPFEGQEFDIKDGSRFGFTPPTAASWGDQVIAGGSGKYKVRYDGSVWRRIG